jgi:hypothetical protein
MSTTTDPVRLPTPGDVVAIAQPRPASGDPVQDVLVRILDEGVDYLVVQDVDPSTWEPVAHQWHLPLSVLVDPYNWEVIG